MTDEQRNEIIRLAGLWHDAKAKFNAMQMSNVAFDHDEARKQTIATELARAEMHEAECNLGAASIWRLKVGDTASAIVTEGRDPEGGSVERSEIERAGEQPGRPDSLIAVSDAAAATRTQE